MKKNKLKAFTLIEVLIALFIIAIALSAAIRATNESIRATTHVRTTTAAHIVAMNILSQIQVGLIVLSPSSGPLTGQTKMLGQEWSWSVSIEKNTATTTFVSVSVSLKDRNITRVEGYVEKT